MIRAQINQVTVSGYGIKSDFQHFHVCWL